MVGVLPVDKAHAIRCISAILSLYCQCAVGLDTSLDVKQYAHTAWRIEEGFTSSPIGPIAQTPDGYLWLGTNTGVLRFDGIRNVQWQPPDNWTLPDPHIRALFGARDGTLWIGTNAGLVSWSGGKLAPYPALKGWSINGIVEDRPGVVWLTAMSEGRRGRLCSVQNANIQCYGDDSSLGATWLGSLCVTNKGELWTTTLSGLWRWHAPATKFIPMSPPPFGGFQTLAEAQDGALLIVTHTGIARLVGDTLESYARGLPRIRAESVFRDRDGGIWIGTRDRGLVHVHGDRTDTFGRIDGLSGNDVHRIFEDHEGNVWIATERGLDRFHDVLVATYSVEQGLSNASVMSVLASRNGSLWISTLDGLNRWDRGNVRIYGPRNGSPESGPGRRLATPERDDSGLPSGLGSLFEDQDGRLWIGSNKGLGYLENDRYVSVERMPEGSEPAHAITQDAAGVVWVAHERGLLRVSPARIVGQIPWMDLTGEGVGLRLVADSRPASLWIAFAHSVAHFVDGHIRESYSHANGLPSGRVHDVRLDPDGALWVGTDGGLSRIKNGRIATLDSRSGLPCDSVDWSLRDEAGAMWVYTACGIALIARTELAKWTAALDHDHRAHSIGLTVFGYADGVISSDLISGLSPHVTKSPDGRLEFATPSGVGVVDPGHLHANPLPPPVKVEQIIAERKAYGASSLSIPLRLPPRLRDLEVDYTALSLVAPEKVRFRYKLEGHDRAWQDVGNRRQAFYNDLPPGKYRFRVIASNNSGVWNEQGATLDFSIAPAYWQTTWFRALCLVAIAGLLWALYLLRLRQVARNFERTLDARVAERTRIARDLHDTLLQSFNGVFLHLATVARLLRSQPEAAQNLLDETIAHARRAMKEGRDAVQDLRTSTEEPNNLAEAISQLAAELSGSNASPEPAGAGVARPIEIRVEVAGKSRRLHPIVRDEVYRIAAEALRNALQHAQATHIEVELRYDVRRFRLEVRDDGRGIEQELLATGGREGHFGLKGMRERAELAGGTLKVWSAGGSGTEVEVSIPASRAYVTARS